jgi:hypothetical protein
MFLSFQKNKYLLIAFIPALIFYLFFLKYGVNAPYADDISAVNALVIRFFYGHDTWWNKFLLLFSQCNEHRLFYLSTIAVVQFALTGEINFIILDLVGGLACLGLLFIFYKIILKYQYPSWLIIPISFILFNLTYFQNIFWTVCALQHNSLPFFVLLLIWILRGSASFARFFFSLLVAFLAVFTSGNGFLVFIAVIPLLLKYSRKYLIFWIFAGISCFILYMSNYEHPYQRGSLFDNVFKIKEILYTFFVYLGSISSVFFFKAHPFRLHLSFILGLGSFASILIIYWKNKSQLLEKEHLLITLSAVFLFLFGTMGLYALARANEPIESVFESRYAINSSIYFIAFLLLIFYQRVIHSSLKWLLIVFSVLFFGSSYLSKFVSVVNFSNELAAGVFTNKSLNRGYYFYSDSAGKKVDLTAPTVTKLSQLSWPIVNITAQLPASIKYFNDVIYLSSTNQGLQPFNQQFVTIYESFDQETRLSNSPKNDSNVLRIWSEKDGFRYSGKGISARITKGQDGVYAVLMDNDSRKWVFNMFWIELDRRKQLTHWDAIYVRNLEGIIPFKYLPDGKYVLKIFKVQDEKIELIGIQNNLVVSGI